VCLTGLSQIAECWLLLARMTDRRDYFRAAQLANAFVRRTIAVDGPVEVRGGCKRIVSDEWRIWKVAVPKLGMQIYY